MEVARTILQQLGGNRFAMLTGARKFVAAEKGLSFVFPQPAAGKPNACTITLTPRDEYDIVFSYVRFPNVPRVVEEHKGIYCDQLLDIFEGATGLYGTFARRSA
jgi:hypothetical protein